MHRAVIAEHRAPGSQNPDQSSHSRIGPTAAIGKGEKHIARRCTGRQDPERDNDSCPTRQVDEKHDALNEWELFGEMDVEERSKDQ